MKNLAKAKHRIKAKQKGTGYIDWICIEIDYHVPTPPTGYSYGDGLVSVQVAG